MPSQKLETEVDRLFQLSPEQFTAARNALAKRVGGSDASHIRTLKKPTLAAWGVNQLHWRDRKTFESLLGSAEKLFRAQKAAMTGGKGDVRKANAAHGLAVQAAQARVLQLIEEAGLRATPATRHAVLQILEALPGGAQPGRLTSTLKPTGFDVFSGIQPIPAARRSPDPGERRKPRLKEAKSVARGKSSPKPGARDRAALAHGAAMARAEERERRENARRTRKELAELKRKLRSAQAEARRAKASSRSAASRLDRERAREQQARSLHEKAVENLAEAEAESKRLREEEESLAAMVQQAEEEVERVSAPPARKSR